MQSALYEIGLLLVVVSLVPPFLFFIAYPLLLSIAALLTKRPQSRPLTRLPSVSFVVVARNAADQAREKIDDCFGVDYPGELVQVVFYSDGSTDQTISIARSVEDPRLASFETTSHAGKIAALNKAVQHCTGDILVFSDVDARIEPDALKLLVRHFGDERVGGVCGRRMLADARNRFQRAQSDYLKFDAWIKRMESNVTSISSSDGKLLAIRRELFQRIPDAVTDDTFMCLSVVSRFKRFVYEPAARAIIRVPSLDWAHELVRRRRIVSQALMGIYHMRAVLNPFRHGMFSIGVIVNKIMRRLMGISLPLLFVGALLMSVEGRVARAFVVAQVFVFALALLEPVLPQRRRLAMLLRPLSGLRYFFLGLLGTLFGILDFARGKPAHAWETVSASKRE